jgi:hypothetical protein
MRFAKLQPAGSCCTHYYQVAAPVHRVGRHIGVATVSAVIITRTAFFVAVGGFEIASYPRGNSTVGRG